MKSNISILFLLSTLLFSCSNDLDLTSEPEEITIVYGLINQVDAEQYIQIYKGFLDDKTNALDIAQIPDSIYFNDSLEVKIESGGNTIILPRVDGNQIGLTKEQGIFANEPNWLYILSTPINQDQQYKLIIKNKSTGKLVTATTPIVKDFSITRPPADFEDFKVNWAGRDPFTVEWIAAENGKVYDLIVRFYYEQWDVAAPSIKDTLFVDWIIFTNRVFDKGHSFGIDGAGFYTNIRSKVAQDDHLIRRGLRAPLEFIFYVGAEEFQNYLLVNRAQSGLTQLSATPEYTNVENGLGIFSSRYTKSRKDVAMTNLSLDSLSCGSVTRNLNFIDSSCN